MNRRTDRQKKKRARREEEEEEEGAVNPFPTVCHICGLTQTGKQAALLRKPQTVPQRNSGLLYESGRAREREREREKEREKETPQLTVQFSGGSLGCAAYLFGRLLPLSENKHVPVI